VARAPTNAADRLACGAMLRKLANGVFWMKYQKLAGASAYSFRIIPQIQSETEDICMAFLCLEW
jgi:hypothetical protein